MVGGIYSRLGPTVGAIITILLGEVLRIGIGTGNVCLTDSLCMNAAGFPFVIYGILLISFIIFLPKGIVGGIESLVQSKPEQQSSRA